MQMKEKLSKKFFYVLVWIFPVIRLLGFASLGRMTWCGPLTSPRLRVRCPFARLKTRFTSSFPLPWPLRWLEHVRAEVTLRSQCHQHPRMSPRLVTCLFWAHILSSFHPPQPSHCFSKYMLPANWDSRSYFFVHASAFSFCTGIVTPSILDLPMTGSDRRKESKHQNSQKCKVIFLSFTFFRCLPLLWEKSTKVNSRVCGLCKPMGSSCYHWPVSRGYWVPQSRKGKFSWCGNAWNCLGTCSHTSTSLS